MAQWGIAIAFAGAIIGVCTSWRALPRVERRRYRAPFIISVLIMGAGVIMQLVAIICL